MTVVEFLEYLSSYATGARRTSAAFRDRAALYLRSVCFGIGRLYFLSKKDESWTASSLAELGGRLGPQGKRCRPMPGLMKELVETCHGLRGQGVNKVSNIALGYEVVRKKGRVKRGLSLEDLSQPKKRARAGGFGRALSREDNGGGSNSSEDAEALSLEENTKSPKPDERVSFKSTQGYKCELHYAWNYCLSTRLAFNANVTRGTMSLDGTDVGNGKIVTCVVGDMDKDLHAWAPPMDPTYVIEI